MNKLYNIGDKVETTLGVGEIIEITQSLGFAEILLLKTKDRITRALISLQPYKSAHDKLLEKGFKLVYNLGNKSYKLEHKEKGGYTIIDILPKENLYSISNENGKSLLINTELTDIMKQYMEEL